MSMVIYDDKCIVCNATENLHYLPPVYLIATELRTAPSFEGRVCEEHKDAPNLPRIAKNALLEWCAKNEITWVK